MPTWVTRLNTLGQAALVAIGVAAIVILALNHIIDGAAALTSIIIVLGVGGAVTGVTHAAAETAKGTNGHTDKPV
jgi:hypothetical protein